jgi:uncharacterized protein (TIGR02452 family)
VAAANAASAASSVTYNPTHNFPVPGPGALPGEIELTRETTIGALGRLIASGQTQSVALDFANPLGPGGAFLRGSIAQEEAICHCSMLFNLLPRRSEMSTEIKINDHLYTDYMSVIPNVPIIRDDKYDFLEQPFSASFIACAAPNAFEYSKISEDQNRLHSTLKVRIRKIVLCAIAHQFTSIVLGAFGCGTFRNSPNDVAAIFRQILIEEGLRSHFHTIVFALYAPTRENEEIFRAELLPTVG